MSNEVRLNDVGRNTRVGKQMGGEAETGAGGAKQHLGYTESQYTGLRGATGNKAYMTGEMTTMAIGQVAKRIAEMAVNEVVLERTGVEGDMAGHDMQNPVSGDTDGVTQLVSKTVTAV